MCRHVIYLPLILNMKLIGSSDFWFKIGELNRSLNEEMTEHLELLIMSSVLVYYLAYMFILAHPTCSQRDAQQRVDSGSMQMALMPYDLFS
jgi:hypothetical protein